MDQLLPPSAGEIPVRPYPTRRRRGSLNLLKNLRNARVGYLRVTHIFRLSYKLISALLKTIRSYLVSEERTRILPLPGAP
jgi:hypothetical protein